MIKYIVALVMSLSTSALVAAEAPMTCDEVFQAASKQEAAAGKAFKGGKNIPGALMLVWSDGATTDVLLLVAPGRQLDDSKLFKSVGVCRATDGQEANVYVASTKNDPV